MPSGMTRTGPSRRRISGPTRSKAATTSPLLASIPILVRRRASRAAPYRDELDAKITFNPAARRSATRAAAPGKSLGPGQIVPSRSKANPRISPRER